MKKIGIIAVLAAALTSGGAYAADILGRGGSTKDDFGHVNKVDFSGAYVGVGAGGQFVNTPAVAEVVMGDGWNYGDLEGIGGKGLVGEAILGFDIRRSSFVFGPRIIGGVTNVSAEFDGNEIGNIDAYLNIGGRAGVVFNRTLIYIHGGYERQWLSSDYAHLDAAFDDADINAVTGGLGLETMLTDSISFVVEGTYIHGLDDAEDSDGGRGVARLIHRF
jgi:hypothetical protein